MERAFSFITKSTRLFKPRETGLTMMIDWGLGPSHQKDLLQVVHEFVDISKIAVGIAGLIDINMLKEKIAVYKNKRVEPFIGGQFLEKAIHDEGLDVAERYFEQARGVGFTYIEVSDNTLEIDANEKYDLIRKAHGDFGFTVLGEVGSKRESSSIDALVEGIQGCLEAGSWKIFLEGAEFINKERGGMLQDVVESVASRIDLKDVMFELPGIWIPNVRTCDIHEMTVHLIKTFGPEVNIANVMPDWVFELETLRTGMGVLGV